MSEITLDTQLFSCIKKHQKSSCQRVIVYVYPKDDTPGCTQQSTDFSESFDSFIEMGIEVIGLSKDSEQSHQKFIEKYGFKHSLISDVDLTFIKQLGAYGEKNNYGKVSMGVIRSTYLINMKNQTLVKSWHNVRAKGHVAKITREILEIQEK